MCTSVSVYIHQDSNTQTLKATRLAMLSPWELKNRPVNKLILLVCCLVIYDTTATGRMTQHHKTCIRVLVHGKCLGMRLHAGMVNKYKKCRLYVDRALFTSVFHLYLLTILTILHVHDYFHPW